MLHEQQNYTATIRQGAFDMCCSGRSVPCECRRGLSAVCAMETSSSITSSFSVHQLHLVSLVLICEDEEKWRKEREEVNKDKIERGMHRSNEGRINQNSDLARVL